MRVIFFGSPVFALPSLEALLGAGHEIALVVTQPDRPAGRGKKSTAPPVASFARDRGLAVWQTASLKGNVVEERLRAIGAHGMALAAFAALVPSNLLDLAPTGILNVHPSLLPRWRGAAPIQSSLRAGETVTGVSIMRLVKELDAGPVLLQERVTVAPDDDYVTLEPRLATLGGELLVRALDEHPSPQEQDPALATFSRRLEREDGRIDWTRPAADIWHQVRAYRAWPTAFTHFDRQELKVLRASPIEGLRGEPGIVDLHGGAPIVATGDGALRLDEVQLAGKRAMPGAQFAMGSRRLHGAKLA